MQVHVTIQDDEVERYLRKLPNGGISIIVRNLLKEAMNYARQGELYSGHFKIITNSDVGRAASKRKTKAD